MNSVFLFIFSRIKSFLISDIASYILIFSLPSIFLVFSIILMVQIAVKKPIKLRVFNGYLAVLAILAFNIVMADGLFVQKLFVGELDFSIYISGFLMLAIIGNVALSTIKMEGVKTSKLASQLKVDDVIEKQKDIEVVRCFEEPTSVYSGYIDVSYVKSLIDKLKENPLEETDEKEIEEFELFIINFVNRQPNGYERKKMSEYMGSLIKKLAKYNAI